MFFLKYYQHLLIFYFYRKFVGLCMFGLESCLFVLMSDLATSPLPLRLARNRRHLRLFLRRRSSLLRSISRFRFRSRFLRLHYHLGN